MVSRFAFDRLLGQIIFKFPPSLTNAPRALTDNKPAFFDI